jgi:hypothetical protein
MWFDSSVPIFWRHPHPHGSFWELACSWREWVPFCQTTLLYIIVGLNLNMYHHNMHIFTCFVHSQHKNLKTLASRLNFFSLFPVCIVEIMLSVCINLFPRSFLHIYFTQQNDATLWCVGVEVHSHISSVMQRLQSQSIPATCPLLLFYHSCSISHFASSQCHASMAL